MRLSPRIASLLAIFLIILIAGCTRPLRTDYAGVTIRSSVSENAIERLTELNLLQAYCLPLDKYNPCTCMYCDNQTRTIFGIAIPYSDRSLAGGQCGFYKCNSTNFEGHSPRSDSTNVTRAFMLGQGRTGYEFSGATLTDSSGNEFIAAGNSLCTSHLRMSVRWLSGDAENAPFPPSTQQAICLLKRDVIPLYIYYTRGERLAQNPPLPPRAIGDSREIGESLYQAGPAFVTSELNADTADPDVREAVLQQLEAYKNSCPNCMTVLAARDMDTEGLDSIFFLPGTNVRDPRAARLVDAIGQGFILNEDAQSCDMEVLLGKRLKYAKENITRNYYKPSIWLYVGISPGEAAAPRCTWTNDDVARGYLYLLQRMQAMADSGIIGMAPYELVDGYSPLPCNSNEIGCNFGLADENFVLKEPQAAQWFNGCASIFNNGTFIGNVFSTNGAPAFCSFAQWGLTARTSIEYGTNRPLETEITDGSYIGPAYRCASCISFEEDVPRPFRNTESYPDYDPSLMPWLPEGQSWCTARQHIDFNAEAASIDPFLLRAVAIYESKLDPCAISWVSQSNNGCNLEGRTVQEMLGLPDNPMSILCEASGQQVDLNPQFQDLSTFPPVCKPRSRIEDPNNVGEECKPCALGLLQCIERAGGTYEPAGEQIPSTISLCGGETYDPFSPGDSACCGAGKLSNAIQDAREFLAQRAEYTGLEAGSQTEYAIIFLALIEYSRGSGIYEEWFDDYLWQQGEDPNGFCHGNVDANFIEYLSGCKPTSYSKTVLSYYHLLRDCPNNDCAGHSITSPQYPNNP